jgi:hypothetical protein
MTTGPDTETHYFDENVNGPQRHDDSRIPSAYKLWMQTALNTMQVPPQMMDALRREIHCANENLVVKINGIIQSGVASQQADLATYKQEQLRIQSDTSIRLTAIETEANTLRRVFTLAFTVGATLLAGSFTLVAIFK